MGPIYGNIGHHIHNQTLNEQAINEVGDGQLPNKFFVSVSNAVAYKNADGEMDFKPINGTKYRSAMIEVFLSEKAAKDAAEAINLDPDHEICSVTVEDRMTGQVYDRHIVEKVEVTYETEEVNDDFNL